MSRRCGATSPSCCKGIYEAELGLGGSTARRIVRANFVCRSLAQDVHGQYPDIFRGTSGKYPPRCQKGRRPKNRSRMKGVKAFQVSGALARCLFFLCARSFFWVVVVGWSVCGLVLVSVLPARVLRCLGCLGFSFSGAISSFLKERATSQEPFFAQEGFVVRYSLCMMVCEYLVVLSYYYSPSISFHLALSRVAKASFVRSSEVLKTTGVPRCSLSSISFVRQRQVSSNLQKYRRQLEYRPDWPYLRE